MKSLIIAVLVILFLGGCRSQREPKMETRNLPAITVRPGQTIVEKYHPSYTRHFDLEHTSLDIRPDYNTQQLSGTALITLHPHFYPTDSLHLNARGMLLHKIALITSQKDTTPLNYVYRNDTIAIYLNRIYKKDEKLNVLISYTSRPEELKDKQSGDAITDDKGLYFINPLGKEKGKPRQLWTQSETQAASAWFPTIDAPNQKMTQDIRLTVDTQDVSLSNGKMVSSVVNNDGTRTDTWKMEDPHSPYLVMIAAGPFAVIKDQWRNKEVNYYVEPEYEDVAHKIFGNTPEMMEFYSKRLGVDYPWNKYSQITVRDFVSGAMENTTATVHMEGLQRDSRELLDENYEDFIAHELFHQWFGDLVTCESWANIPLNESFATYGEYLWFEHKYGKDEADYTLNQDLHHYLREARTKQVNLIRYVHGHRNEMFDRHSYQKGGCILHMLRNHVGDDAFFAALKSYLTRYRYQNVEIHNLRLVFEEITGQDLNWFFDQWFLDKGHPELGIHYNWNELTKNAEVTIIQNQDSAGIRLFRIPLAVDIYTNAGVKREQIVIENKEHTFRFALNEKPALINIDADKILVGKKTDHHTPAEWIYQYYHAPLFADRLEAVKAINEDYPHDGPEAVMLKDALNDKHWYIRSAALNKLNIDTNHAESATLKNKVVQMASSDPKSKVRVAALELLIEKYSSASSMSFYRSMLNDSSYSVMQTAMDGIISINPDTALSLAEKFEKENHQEIREMLTSLYGNHGGQQQAKYMLQVQHDAVGNERYSSLNNFGRFLKRIDEEATLSEGITRIGEDARNAEPWYIRFAAMQALADLFGSLKTKKQAAEQKNNISAAAKYSNLMDQCYRIMVEVRDAETDESLKKLYQGKSE